MQYECQTELFQMGEGEWRSWLHELLPRPKAPTAAPAVLDLFAGCGGLTLGFEVQGFRSIGYEMKKAPAETYARNLSGSCHEVFLEIGMPEETAEVIIGGATMPAVQPVRVSARET